MYKQPVAMSPETLWMATIMGLLMAFSIAPADAYWRMSCGIIQASRSYLLICLIWASPSMSSLLTDDCSASMQLQQGRIDSIINPGAVSGHVHKISGAASESFA